MKQKKNTKDKKINEKKQGAKKLKTDRKGDRSIKV